MIATDNLPRANTKMTADKSMHTGLSFRLTQAYFAYRGLLEKKIKSTSFGKLVPNGCVSLWFYVMSHDGCTPTEVVRELGLSKSTVSSQIDQLEGKGLMERRPSNSDGRSVLLHVTDKSRAFSGEVESFVSMIDAELAEGHGEDTARLLAGLQGIHRHTTSA